MTNKTLEEVLNRYYRETVGSIVNKTPSTLNRGEGTEIDYYIMKIDLVDSTLFTKGRSHQTYLKLAHTFLSSVDEISRDFGADEDQTEYAGDSVIAYFRATEVDAIEVLAAAGYCREAALRMRSLDFTLNRHHFLTKTVIHYGNLIMAKIGPRGDSFVSAIGPELHKACKMEATVPPGQGRASKEFRERLKGKEKLLVKANYKEVQVAKQSDFTVYTRRNALAELFYPSSQPTTIMGLSPRSVLENFSNKVASPEQQFEIQKELINYKIDWEALSNYLNKK